MIQQSIITILQRDNPICANPSNLHFDTEPDRKTTRTDLLFHSPVTQNNCTHTIPLVPRLHPNVGVHINCTIRHAWASSTLAKYGDGVAHFHAFCNAQNIPYDCRLPASEFLLCAFAAASTGIRSGAATRNDISGVRAWHIIQDVPYHGSVRLNYVIKGVENLAPGSSKHPPCPPITLQMLEVLASSLDHSSPLDTCVYACALVTFWSQCRLGEMLSTTQTQFKSPHEVPCLTDLFAPITHGGSCKLFLPKTKTTGFRGAYTFITAQLGCTNPIPALDNHIAINSPPEHYPLFSYRAGNGHVCLTARKFLTQCNSIWTANAYPSSTGHSFRIGGTTELLLRGVPPDVVKMLGRWKSDAFLAYWRSLELIAPLYAEYLSPMASTILPPRK